MMHRTAQSMYLNTLRNHDDKNLARRDLTWIPADYEPQPNRMSHRKRPVKIVCGRKI